MKIKYTDIIKGDRARQEFGDVKELSESLLEYGFIHPIALDSNMTIVAGGRRFAALGLLRERRKELVEREDIDASMLRFLQNDTLELGVHYTSKVDSDLALCDEMELEENVRRKNFSWKEEVVAINKIHRRSQKKARDRGDSWGVRETGRLLGVSHASIGYATKLYACLADPQHPVQNCVSATDALNKLVEMKSDEARRLAVKRNIITTGKTKGAGVEVSLADLGAQLSAGRLSDDPGLEEFDFDEDSDTIKSSAYSTEISFEVTDTAESIVEKKIAKSEEVLIDMSKYLHGDFLSLVADGTLKEGQFNHVLTDPPYGIDMKNLAYGDDDNVARIEDSHKVSDNVANFGKWLEAFYYVMRDSGFCVLWCDYAHFQTLREQAEAVGFKAQKWPFIWCKTHTCMNQAADFNFTKNTECALILRKGSATLVKPQGSSYYMASSAAVKKELSGHPFVKPLELWLHLAQAISLENESILDPFAGVGSMPRALISRNNVWTCELDEDIYNQQLTMIMKYFRELFPTAKFIR